ncbi:Folate-biopterin transporter 1, chloroplastic, partial [Mucuna pruriens]
KIISSVLSRLIDAFSWSLMATFVDNKYNIVFFFFIAFLDVLWRGHAVSHKAPQDIFRDSFAFGGIVSSYFGRSLMDTYGVEFVFGVTTLLPLLAPTIVVFVKEQARFSTARKKIYLLPAPVTVNSSSISLTLSALTIF